VDASLVQVASAPASPPRLPVTLVVLVTKKLTDGADGAAGPLSSPHAAAARITIDSETILILSSKLNRSRARRLTGNSSAIVVTPPRSSRSAG
jgi:hypothetical protein